MRNSTQMIVALAAALFAAGTPSFGVSIGIDVNSNSSPTAPGFVGLDIPGTGTGNGSSVTDQGVTFTVFSSDGHRDRGGPNDLTRDFIFDDGAGQAVGLVIDGLASKVNGNALWMAEVWSFDNSFNPVGNQFVGLNNTPSGEIIFTSTFAGDATQPFTFTFQDSDIDDSFGIFTRENNGNNRSRFNAVRLTQIVPEPTTAVLGLMGLAGLATRRRRAA